MTTDWATWLSEPTSVGWLILAALGLVFLLVLATRANDAPLDDRHGEVFSASEPEERGTGAPYGLRADEVEETDGGAQGGSRGGSR